jgi:hypothetical protein
MTPIIQSLFGIIVGKVFKIHALFAGLAETIV